MGFHEFSPCSRRDASWWTSAPQTREGEQARAGLAPAPIARDARCGWPFADPRIGSHAPGTDAAEPLPVCDQLAELPDVMTDSRTTRRIRAGTATARVVDEAATAAARAASAVGVADSTQSRRPPLSISAFGSEVQSDQTEPLAEYPTKRLTGYVDIHSHVLPGIDDGPADLDGAIAMAQAAAAVGTRTLVATPHLRADFPDVRVDELADRVQALRETIAERGIDLEIIAAAEVSLVWALEASADDLALATYGQRGTDLLVETPAGDVAGLANFLFMLQSMELRVTLAHPERNPGFQRDPSPLADLVRQGVLLQVNADALLEVPASLRSAS